MSNNYCYKGVWIEKDDLTIAYYSRICDKINDCTTIVINEPKVYNCSYPVYAQVMITDSDYLFCEVSNKKCLFGIYNQNKNSYGTISAKIISKLKDTVFYDLANELSKTISLYELNTVKVPFLDNVNQLNLWKLYKENILPINDNVNTTKAIKFVNRPYEKEINTSQELKTAIQRANKKQKSYTDWER